MMNSSAKESPQQNRNGNESKNITTILPPEITSTPFISNKSKAASPLVTPTRKFSGPRRYALSNNGMLNPVRTIKDPPGPLLASTAYNVNVSTYIDSKSPGYAGRLVQYNEENACKQNTHQERYGSPGLFPIVHLFKKEVPVISPKLKKGTIRIGTPESRGYYSQEHNRSLLEGIVRNNSILKEQNNSNETSTRSVLDALKEISRKRIHASEEYDPIDDNNKKFRKANGDGDYSKRNRVESPPSEKANSPSTTQAKKKLCTIDAVLASKTSSMYANYEMGTKRKSSEDSNSRILPMNKKKFNNVETQTPGTPVIVRELKRNTINEEIDKKKSEKPIEEVQVEVEKERSSPPKQILKVLDDKPLEVIRKNRLGALLSALSGREIPSLPMEDRRKALDQEWPSQSSEKTLVSILSPQNKKTKSVEKHVSFNLTEAIPSTPSSGLTNISENNQSDKEEKEDTKKERKENDSSLSLQKNSSEDDKKSTGFMQTPEKIGFGTTTMNNKLNEGEDKKAEEKKIVGGFKFDLNIPLNQRSTTDAVEESKTKPQIDFCSPSTSSSSKPVFDPPALKSDSGSTITSKSTSETSFMKSPLAPMTNSLGLPTSLPLNNSTASETTSTVGSFKFGATVSEAISVSTNSGEKTTAVFTFGNKAPLKSESANSTTNEPANASATPTFTKNEGLSLNSSPFGSKIASSVESIAPINVFNRTNNESTNSNIPTSSVSSSNTPSGLPICAASSVLTASSPTFSAATGSSSVFTSKTFDTIAASSTISKVNFGTSLSSPGGFKFNGSNSLPAFGSPSSNSVTTQASAIQTNLFGSPLNVVPPVKNEIEKSSGTNNVFGSSLISNTTPQMQGNNLLSNKSFSQDLKPLGSGSEKNTESSSISANTAAFTFKPEKSDVITSNTSANPSSNVQFSSSFPSFGTNSNVGSGKNQVVSPFQTSTIAPSLGTSNTFTFGKSVTTSSTTPTSKTSLFSSTNPSSFAPSTTPSFGTVNSVSFSTTNTPSFGNTNTTNFASTNTPNFGTTNTVSFGTSTTPTFGSTSTPSFGNPSTTNFGTSAFDATKKPTISASNTFGSINTPSFGTTNTSPFNSANSSNLAINKTSSFGNTNPLAFGTTNAPAFSTNNITASGTNSFGVTSTTVPSSTPSFGNPTTAVFGTTNAASFGNATASSGFGTSASTPSLPTFGNPSSPFGNAISSNVNTFNSNNTSSPFGNTSGTNSFGTFNANKTSFTPVTTAPSFGTNTNNTFGSSTATNAFGRNNTFGSSNPAGPFGANASAASSNAFASGFGKKPEQSNIFPAASNNMFNGNSTFGTVQSNNNGGIGGGSSSGVFTFGSSNSNAPSSAGVFTFGASEPPKTFNFNAASNPGNISNPSGNEFNSSFGQPSTAVPNMFSIGSGNTTSTSQARGRPLVRARRRT